MSRRQSIAANLAELRQQSQQLNQLISDAPFNWEQELADIASPLFDSLRDITRRPHQRSALRDPIALARHRIEVLQRALGTLNALPVQTADSRTRDEPFALSENRTERLRASNCRCRLSWPA